MNFSLVGACFRLDREERRDQPSKRWNNNTLATGELLSFSYRNSTGGCKPSHTLFNLADRKGRPTCRAPLQRASWTLVHQNSVMRSTGQPFRSQGHERASSLLLFLTLCLLEITAKGLFGEKNVALIHCSGEFTLVF